MLVNMFALLLSRLGLMYPDALSSTSNLCSSFLFTFSHFASKSSPSSLEKLNRLAKGSDTLDVTVEVGFGVFHGRLRPFGEIDNDGGYTWDGGIQPLLLLFRVRSKLNSLKSPWIKPNEANSAINSIKRTYGPGKSSSSTYSTTLFSTNSVSVSFDRHQIRVLNRFEIIYVSIT